MELPDWIVDEVLAPAPPSAFRLAIFVFRHGRALVGADGGRRAYWRGTVPQLARLAGMDKKSVINAQRYLVQAGLLTLHRTRANTPHSVSVRFDRPLKSGVPGGHDAVLLADETPFTRGQHIRPPGTRLRARHAADSTYRDIHIPGEGVPRCFVDL